MAASPTQAAPERHIPYYPWVRLLVCAAFGAAAYALMPPEHSGALRALLGWDAGVFALIAWTLAMMATSTPHQVRRRAALQDQGRTGILVVIVAGALASLAALAFIQKVAKAAQGNESLIILVTIVTTILMSWFLVHIVFALHYAHAYYGPSADENDEDGLVGGLEFPGEKEPDYWDFMYFSFVVGMTAQVSDVQVTDRGLRQLTLVHGIVSFFFNTIILALTINIVASLI
jgi:uncharacterized membrane protein